MSVAQIALRRIAISTAIVVAAMYLGAAFVTWDLNPGHWPAAQRASAVLFTTLILGIVVIPAAFASALDRD